MTNRQLIFTLAGSLINNSFYLSKSLGSKLGYYFFQSERRLNIRQEDQQFLEDHEYVMDDYAEGIKYYKWGESDKTILMLHGWESGAIRWKPYIEGCLSKGYQVVALDAPGHGLSLQKKFNVYLYSEAITPIIKHLKPDVIIGHSIGGFTAIHSGNALPDYQPSKYILLAPNNNLLHVFNIYKQKLGLSEGVMLRLLEDAKKIEGKPMSYYISETLLNQITSQVEIIHDENDEVLPYHDSAILADMHSHVNLQTTKGYGHKLRSYEIVKKVIDLL